MKTKIANAEQMKVHPADAGLVICNRDMEAHAVSVRVRGKWNLGAKPGDEVIADIFQSIKERRAISLSPICSYNRRRGDNDLRLLRRKVQSCAFCRVRGVTGDVD